MKPTVYFSRTITPEKVLELYQKLGVKAVSDDDDIIAISSDGIIIRLSVAEVKDVLQALVMGALLVPMFDKQIQVSFTT